MKIRGIKLARKAFSDRPENYHCTNFLDMCFNFWLQAFYHALSENWNLVIIFIIIAAVDLLDGRVARLLKSTSNFGMYLTFCLILLCLDNFSNYNWFLDGRNSK